MSLSNFNWGRGRGRGMDGGMEGHRMDGGKYWYTRRNEVKEMWQTPVKQMFQSSHTLRPFEGFSFGAISSGANNNLSLVASLNCFRFSSNSRSCCSFCSFLTLYRNKETTEHGKSRNHKTELWVRSTSTGSFHYTAFLQHKISVVRPLVIPLRGLYIRKHPCTWLTRPKVTIQADF